MLTRWRAAGHDVTVVASREARVEWVLLVHRVPREPSSPRIAIWRRLRALGVGQLGDGVVALPSDARTREHLEWVADRVVDAGGTAVLLQAQALSRRDEETIARAMAQARAAEYDELRARAEVALADLVPSAADAEGPGSARSVQVLRKLRSDLRAITRRDYFPPPEREAARRAVEACAAAIDGAAIGGTAIDGAGARATGVRA